MNERTCIEETEELTAAVTLPLSSGYPTELSDQIVDLPDQLNSASKFKSSSITVSCREKVGNYENLSTPATESTSGNHFNGSDYSSIDTWGEARRCSGRTSRSLTMAKQDKLMINTIKKFCMSSFKFRGQEELFARSCLESASFSEVCPQGLLRGHFLCFRA